MDVLGGKHKVKLGYGVLAYRGPIPESTAKALCATGFADLVLQGAGATTVEPADAASPGPTTTTAAPNQLLLCRPGACRSVVFGSDASAPRLGFLFFPSKSPLPSRSF